MTARSGLQREVLSSYRQLLKACRHLQQTDAQRAQLKKRIRDEYDR